MRVLVTGGAGMIGSHLVDALLARGDEVVIVDSLLTGRRENLAHLTTQPGFAFHAADVEVLDHLSLGPLDRIYHLASPASPLDFARYPIETLMANAVGTRAALTLAERCQARFLLASTSEVYGEPAEHPQRETYHDDVNVLGPRACHDEGKRFAESLSIACWRTLGVDVRIARLFNTYGPRSRLDDGRVVPAFCVQVLTGQPLTVFGSGQQTRSLCYIDDLVRGLIALMEAPGLAGEVVNLGCPKERPVLDIAVAIQRATGSASPIVRRPLPIDDPARRCPDITRARPARLRAGDRPRRWIGAHSDVFPSGARSIAHRDSSSAGVHHTRGLARRSQERQRLCITSPGCNRGIAGSSIMSPGFRESRTAGGPILPCAERTPARVERAAARPTRRVHRPR
jgi:nucleoside-diphosphate-sugar epimerase